MTAQFPKTRKPLPLEYQSIYQRHFQENRTGATKASNIASKMERWMHKQVASDLKRNPEIGRTLELGAGGLNHLPHEPNVQEYDVVEPHREMMNTCEHLSRVRNIYDNIYAISGRERYRRIISIAVLEHLVDLPAVIAKCGLLLEEDGSFRAGIPNEGTVLWRMGQRLTTGLEFRLRYRLDYNVLMRHEHVNTADEIEEVLKDFFRETQCRCFGFSKRLAFYRFYECSRPDKERCRHYLKEHTEYHG